MKLTGIVVLFLTMVLPFTADAQRSRRPQSRPRTLEGVVVGKQEGPRWIGIVVESGGRRYLVTLSNNPDNRVPDPVVIGGDVELPGTWVRVTYTGSEAWGGNMLALAATRVVRLQNQIVSPPKGGSKQRSDSSQPSRILEFDVPHGRTLNSFTYTRRGNLTYDGRNFSPPVVANTTRVKTFRISFVRSSGLAGVILVDGDGFNKSFLLDTNASSSTPMQPTDQSNSAQKLFWSPSQRYMVALCSYEGQRFIRIDLNTRRVLEGNFLSRGGRNWRITNDPRWLGDSDVLVFKVNESCDPYNDPACTEGKWERVLATYEVRLDAATLRLSPTRVGSR